MALIEPHFLLESDSTVESHSAASDVLRELTEIIGDQAPCQADEVRTAQKSNINTPETTGVEHSAPEHLKSTAVAWVWTPAGPQLQALNRDQTLGLRSVVP